MKLRWWKRPRLTIEEQLVRRLETKGVRGFYVLRSPEVPFIRYTRPGPSPAVLPQPAEGVEMSDPTQVHVTPATSSDERMHELSDRCWCRPLNEFVTNAATGRNDWVIRHYAPVAAAADAPQPPKKPRREQPLDERCSDACCDLGKDHAGDHYDGDDGKRWTNYDDYEAGQ